MSQPQRGKYFTFDSLIAAQRTYDRKMCEESGQYTSCSRTFDSRRIRTIPKKNMSIGPSLRFCDSYPRCSKFTSAFFHESRYYFVCRRLFALSTPVILSRCCRDRNFPNNPLSQNRGVVTQKTRLVKHRSYKEPCHVNEGRVISESWKQPALALLGLSASSREYSRSRETAGLHTEVAPHLPRASCPRALSTTCCTLLGLRHTASPTWRSLA